MVKEGVDIDSQSLIHTVSKLKKSESPRFLYTHLPFNFLPRQIRTGEVKPKIIYFFRNPKDVCVSYFNFYMLVFGFLGNFDEFCSLFLSGKGNFMSQQYRY